MLKKLNGWLNILMGAFAGSFIGHAAFVCWEYQKYPGLYALQPAPWYTSIAVYGAFAAAALLIAAVLKLVIKKKLAGRKKL